MWLPEGGDGPAESYVNLIPRRLEEPMSTASGGAAGGGARVLRIPQPAPPRGEARPEDVWDRCRYVLSVKMSEPQFTGQTKDRLSSRECAAFVSGVVKNAFQPVAGAASRRWRSNRRDRDCERSASHSGSKAGRAQEGDFRSGASRQARGLHVAGSRAYGAVSRRRRFRRRLGEAGTGPRVPGGDAVAGQDLNPGRSSRVRCSRRRRCTTSPSPSESIPARVT